MNKIYIINLIFLLTACAQSTSEKSTVETVSSSEKPLYVQMANSELLRNPDPRLLDFREKPKWEYSNGLICSAIFKVWEETGDDQYLNYAKYYADSMIEKSGRIKTYKKSDYNIDRVNSGKVLIELYKITGKAKYRKALDTLRSQMREHPRTSEGGFWHKKRYPYQMWLDGLYMGSPFLAQYGLEFNEPELFDEVANQVYLIDKYTWNEEKQLFYHGWDESRAQKWADPITGLSPNFWGRAMGWFAMALVDVLDFIPQDHPKRPDILRVLDKMAMAISNCQDTETGLWWQILDMPKKEGNYLEASCSSMFTYALLKGVDKGYLDKSYLLTATKGFEGISKQFIKKNDDGTISLTNNCAVAGLGGNPYRDGSYEYYIGEPQRDNDPKGVGPFIMASLLYENLPNQ